MKVAVLDIGGTSIKSGLFVDGHVIQQKETPSEAALGGPYVMEKVAKIIEEYAGFDRIGVSTASQVDSQQGIVKYANGNVPNYTGMPIRQMMEQKFGVKTAVDNDVNAAAYGEAVFGAGRTAPHGDFLCLTYGTGVGGAIVQGGKVYTGASFSAGEFGHILTHGKMLEIGEDWQASPYYERYASTNALVEMAQKIDPAMNSGRKIFANLDNPAIKAVVDQWVTEVLYGLVTLIHIFNPSLMVLGGGIMQQKYVISSIQTKIQQYIMPSFVEVNIVAAQLGNLAGLYGIGQLACLI